jgi:hypothetical protein
MEENTVTVTLIQDKETENTIRFQEPKSPSKPALIGTLYVPKTTIADLGNPSSITVTVAAATE